MKKEITNQLRNSARQLIRELGLLNLNHTRTSRSTQEWHSLIEIHNEPNITVSKLGELLLLSKSRISRLISSLIKEDLIIASDGLDKREKQLNLTDKGRKEVKKIDEYTNKKINGALSFLSGDEQNRIIEAMQIYSQALKKNRQLQEEIKIHTLSTSRAIRQQIVNMIEEIQIGEFGIAITPDINFGILRAEGEYYYNHSYNFWYAVDSNGKIVGSIGLKKINEHSGEIKKFFVRENYRGRGISQKLMQTLAKAALKHGMNNIYLGTVDKLRAAQRFYGKYGFVSIEPSALPKSFERCHLDTVFFKIKTQELSSNLYDTVS